MIINTRWGFASAAAIIVLIIVSFAGVFAVRPIEQAQEETLEELVGGEPPRANSNASRTRSRRRRPSDGNCARHGPRHDAAAPPRFADRRSGP